MTKSTETILKSAVSLIRGFQEDLTDDERKQLWNEITDGYCEDCGSDDLPCYCTRDD